MKASKQILTAGLSILWSGISIGANSEGAKPAGRRVDEVVVVFKTHFDIGFTDLASKVVKRYQTTMIDGALEVVDHNRDMPPENRFVWTVPGWPMSKILEDWPGQTKERHERIVSAVRDGRLVWHALPYTTHTESLELEDLVRGMNFSSTLSREFGQPLARCQDDRCSVALLGAADLVKACRRGIPASGVQRGEFIAAVARLVLVGGAGLLARAYDV